MIEFSKRAMWGKRTQTPSPCPTPPSPLNYETWADSHCEWYIKRGHLRATFDPKIVAKGQTRWTGFPAPAPAPDNGGLLMKWRYLSFLRFGTHRVNKGIAVKCGHENGPVVFHSPFPVERRRKCS